MSDEYSIKKTQTLVLIALFSALVTTVTLFTSIQYTAGGYFNLGDVIVMLLATILPFRHALIAASLGSMIADILAGAIHYTVFTGIIKGLMVLVVFLLRNLFKTKAYFIPFLLGSLVMLVGYGIVDAFLLGGYAFFVSISLNAIQAGLGFILSSLMYPLVQKLNKYFKG